jgi:hypothetical protein
MNKKWFLLFITLISSLIFINCENNEPINCYLSATSISSNSPVLSGNSITLSTPSFSENGAIYEWSGPNSFTSSDQNPILTNATGEMAGEYSLKIRKGICETEIMKTTVDVIQNTVVCSPVNNTATFTGGNPTANFYNFSAVAITNNRFEIRASDNNWRVSVIFSGNTTPTSGIYNITNINNTLSANTVHVIATRYTLSGSSFEYNSKSSDVALSYVNGKAIIKFCSVPFSLNNQNSTDFNCTTQFTQN